MFTNNWGITKMKPVVFVAMPFGEKKDPTTGKIINFDDIYEKAIKPLNNDEELGLEVLRACDENVSGIIHRPMYERLLLAEYVIADVSIHNPNVFYELGVRHCAKPMTTFIIFSTPLPFDIQPLRAIFYELKQGQISQESADNLKNQLKEKLLRAKTSKDKDSPIFELIPELNSTINLPEEYTKAFKERAIKINKIRNEIEDIRNQFKITKNYDLKSKLIEIRNSFGDYNELHEALLIEIIRAFKALEAYDLMLESIELVPEEIYNNSILLHQYKAFGLNRLQSHENSHKAIRILEKSIEDFGKNSETFGLLGRVYRDLYNETSEKFPYEKEAYLDKSIDSYKKGFLFDPRDSYPGINAAKLLLFKGAISEMENLIPSIELAIGRLDESDNDFWVQATRIECLLLKKDWINVKLQLGALLSIPESPWKYQTMKDSLLMVKQGFEKQNIETEAINGVIDTLTLRLS